MWEHAYNRLVNRVMKSGKPARAEVVSAEWALARASSGIRTGDVAFPWRVALRVTPKDRDAAPFDLTTKMEIPKLVTPRRGMTLQVIYNPKKPKAIIIDPASVPTDAREAGAIDAANNLRAMELAAADAPPVIDPGADPVVTAREAMMALADGSAGHSDQAIGQAILALRAAAGVESPTPPPSSPPGATQAAIEARLAQLDALKAAGTLDEQTYKSSRQRLLDALLQ